MHWPVVLKPEYLESLISWLERHAEYYKVPIETLFSSGLRMNPPKNILEIDFIKFPKLYSQIEKYTGVNKFFLEKMILESYSPMLFDFVGVHTRNEFDNYTNNFNPFHLYNKHVYPKKTNSLKNINIIPWVSNTPWSKSITIERFCSQCKKENNFYKQIVWHLCLISTCQKHNCYLTEVKSSSNKKTNFTEVFNEPPSKEILSLDKKNYEAFKSGIVHFNNGDTMNGFVWFRFLRSLAKYVCPPEKVITPDIEMFKGFWKNVPIKYETKVPFELLSQNDRISIMKIVAFLVKNWPRNFISKVLYNSCEIRNYKMKYYTPYALSKYIDFPCDKNIYKMNPDFSSKCNWLKYAGLFSEIRYILKRDIRAFDNLIPFMVEYGKMSIDKAKNLIDEFVKMDINRIGATAYEINKDNVNLQIHSENSLPIEVQDHHDLPEYNVQSY